MPRSAVLLVIPAALVFTMFLGFRDLGERSLWDDEVTSIEFARRPPAEIWRARDPNLSPFYYLLVRAWRGALCEEEASLRGLSAAGRVLGFAAIVAFGAAVLGSRGASLSAVLYAVSPPVLLYGRELRPYPLLLAFSCAGLACLWRAGTTDRVRWAVAAGVALVIALMLHYSTLFLLGGLLAAHLLPSLRTRRWALGVTLGVVLLGVLPWAGVFVENLSNLLFAASGREQVPIPFGPPGKASYALFGLVLGETVLPWNWLMVVPAALGSAVLCVLGWRALADRRELRAFLVVPLALAVAALSLTMKAGPRYVFLLLPCLVALFAAGVLGDAPRWLRVGALLAVVVPQLVSERNVLAGREHHNMAMVEPSREVASFLRKEFEEGDVLVYTANPGPLVYYLEGLTEPRYLAWDAEAKLVGGSRSETFDEFLAASVGRTVWWIDRSTGFVPQAEALADRADELRTALMRRGAGSVEWPFGHDPDAAEKRRWIQKAFLDDRIVVRRFDAR